MIGAIMSLMPDGAVHVGIDSFACLKRLWVYMSGSFLEILPRTPWMLIPDGDLWEIFHRAAHAKGVHSILASKVKGHATDKDIDAGKSTPWLRQQNDRSDELATKGTAATPLRCFDIAALYAERQKGVHLSCHCLA